MVVLRIVAVSCLAVATGIALPAAGNDSALGDFVVKGLAPMPDEGSSAHVRRPIRIGKDRTIYRPAAEPFSIFVIPDTQGYADGGCYDDAPCFAPEAFVAQTRYLRRYYDHPDNNTIFVAHLGDVVDDAGRAIEWTRAKRAMRLLDAFSIGGQRHFIPYGIAPGNHDFVSWRGVGTSAHAFEKSFRLSTYKRKNRRWPAWLKSTHRGLRNSLHLFNAGGDQYLILFLEYCPGNRVIGWAKRALARFDERRGIIVTHAATDRKGRWFGRCHSKRGNSGRAIWSKLVAPSTNVHFVLGGHAGYGLGWNAWQRKWTKAGQLSPWWKKRGWDGGTYARKQANDRHIVHVLISNYQHMYRAGNGLFRRMKFFPNKNQVEVLTYSPHVRRFLRDLDGRCGKTLGSAPGTVFPCNNFRLRYPMSANDTP